MEDHLSRYCEIFQLDTCEDGEGESSAQNTTIALEDGGTYQGQINAQLIPDGFGVELYPQGGKRYEGTVFEKP